MGDVAGIFDQGALADEAAEQQFADEAARHDHALVDIEGLALDIGAIDEIGGRLTRACARSASVRRASRKGSSVSIGRCSASSSKNAASSSAFVAPWPNARLAAL